MLRNPRPLNDYLVYRGRPRPNLPAQFGEGGFWQEPRQLRIVKAAAPDRLGDPALAVELVEKGDDQHVAQPADLEELARLLLDAPLAP